MEQNGANGTDTAALRRGHRSVLGNNTTSGRRRSARFQATKSGRALEIRCGGVYLLEGYVQEENPMKRRPSPAMHIPGTKEDAQ